MGKHGGVIYSGCGREVSDNPEVEPPASEASMLKFSRFSADNDDGGRLVTTNIGKLALWSIVETGRPIDAGHIRPGLSVGTCIAVR